MYNEVCKLIPITETANSFGDTIQSEGTARTVFCRIKSYSLKDKFMVGADGDVPELTFVLADKKEYQNEAMLEYDQVKYKVIHVSFDDMHSDIGLVVSKWQRT